MMLISWYWEISLIIVLGIAGLLIAFSSNDNIWIFLLTIPIVLGTFVIIRTVPILKRSNRATKIMTEFRKSLQDPLVTLKTNNSLKIDISKGSVNNCYECGTILHPKDKFCSNCGSDTAEELIL
jgi:hypothetical protein